MHLYSKQPYWLMKDGMISSYTSLAEDVDTDVAVLGAGISGALAAYSLRNLGLHIVVLERRHVGIGSTAASTSFLQYEIDTPLRQLQDRVGAENAVRSYRLCRDSIYQIQRICRSLKGTFDFHLRPSLQFASYKKDKNDLYEEYRLRLKNGFNVKWLEPPELMKEFGIRAPGGILSEDGGEVDAYMLTHGLLRAVVKKGHSVFTNSGVIDIRHSRKNIILTTDRGHKVTTRKLIIACGYESMSYLPRKIADVRSTYAIVSEPVKDDVLWYRNSLIWETADPYMYCRKVNDNRILVGGKDDPFHHPNIEDSHIKKKARSLEQSFTKRFPHITIRADYSWGGVFEVTKDGLPYIGCIPNLKNTYFALGFGGNGITFSAIAAGIIRNMILGKNNENCRLFSFNR